MQSDLDFIAAFMRKGDVMTLTTLYPHKTIEDILNWAVLHSTRCWVFEAAGKPAAVFGVVPLTLLSPIGSPWFLGTEEVFKHRRAFVRYGRLYTRLMLRSYPHLLNYVDARDTPSVQWLAHIGYEVHPPEPYGPGGRLFHKFEMRR